MRILVLSHKFYPDIGGIEINSELLANHFVELGADVHVLTWTKGSNDQKLPYEVIRNPKLLTLLKEYTWADVIFENNLCLRLSWPQLFFRKPHMIAIRSWITRKDSSANLTERIKFKWLKKADKVIAVSEAVRKKNFPAATVIPNPYRSKLFRQKKNSQKKRDFVFLGRLVSDKGVDMAINLLKMLHSSAREFSNLNLTIIGDGPEKKRLKEMVTKYQLNGFVCFTGFLEGEKLNKKMNQHKYLLVPSRCREAFGNVVLEGMACGCLPIASDGGGLPQAVGSAGIIFQRGNKNDFFNSVKKILNNNKEEQRLRNNIKKHLSIHHPKVIAKKYLEIIKDTYKTE